MHGAVRCPPDRRSGACDDSLVLQRLVVVASLLTLAAGAGVGGWAPKFFARSHLCMPSASFLEGRVAACSFFGSGVSTRPYHTVCATPIPLVCRSLVLRAAHTDSVRPLPFGRPHSSFAFLAFRSSDDLLLRLSSVDLMPRLGLNSIHPTTLRSSLARHSSLSA